MNEIIVNLEGKEYKIDIEKAKELGVLKEKNSKCKSWKEFLEKYNSQTGYYFNVFYNEIRKTDDPKTTSGQLTKEDAIAISAFSKLLKLRRDWIGNWNPDWSDSGERKYCIEVDRNEFYVDFSSQYSRTFSFPTEEMAEEFLNCFRNLFEQCKFLI